MEDKCEKVDGKPVITYTRPLDRTPEKTFHLLSYEEKKRTALGRRLVVKARDKIARLEDEVEEREKEVESERKLRQEVEERLQAHFQDMYQSPEVTQELRERLPRANKCDPFRSPEPDLLPDAEESSIEEQIEADVDDKMMSKPKMKPSDMKSLDSQILQNKTPTTHRGATSPKSTRKNLEFTKDSKSPNRSPSSLETQTQTFDRSNAFTMTPPLGTHPGYYGHAFGASPYMPFAGSPLNYPNPLLNSTSLYPPGSNMFRQHSAPVLNLQSSFQNGSMEVPQLSSSLSVPLNTSLPNSQSSSANTSPEKADGAASASGTPSQDSGISSNLSASRTGYSPLRAPRFGLQNSSPLNASFPPNYLSASPMLQLGMGADQSQQIAKLLNELDTQRSEAKKMADKIAEQDRDLGTVRLELRVRDVEHAADNTDTAKAASLVEEVYAAQRKRDEATNGRLIVATQEKEDVLVRLREIERKLEAENVRCFPDSDDEMEFENEEMDQDNLTHLISHLDSPRTSDSDRLAFVNRVEYTRQRQREMANEEMQVVMDQRDAALAKCRKLEAEFLRLQRERDGGGDGMHSLKAKLAAVQRERDMAVAKSRQLDDEIQEIRLHYSLYKSLSQEESLQQSAQHPVAAPEVELRAARQQVGTAQKENDRLTGQLRTATIEKKQLTDALEKVSKEKEKLHRLVTVLRRKLNSMTNQPPPVADSDQEQTDR